MNSSSDSNGRKKRVVSGTGSVKRRSDTPVQTNGPVGKKDGYQGRREQFFGQKPTGSQSTTQQSGSVFTTPQQSAQQNTQQNTQNVFVQQNAQSGTPRASGSGKLIRLLLIVGVIVGGPNKCSTMTPGWMKTRLDEIFAANPGAQLCVTTSRRTPPGRTRTCFSPRSRKCRTRWSSAWSA